MFVINVGVCLQREIPPPPSFKAMNRNYFWTALTSTLQISHREDTSAKKTNKKNGEACSQMCVPEVQRQPCLHKNAADSNIAALNEAMASKKRRRKKERINQTSDIQWVKCCRVQTSRKAFIQYLPLKMLWKSALIWHTRLRKWMCYYSNSIM